MEGDKLVECTREELIEKSRATGWNGQEINLAWTPDADEIVPVERIPFLFEALRARRGKQAQTQLLMSCGWAALLLSDNRGIGGAGVRYLSVFLIFAAVLPAIHAIRCWRAAIALTPEALARESQGSEVCLWFSRQKAPWTIGLGLLWAAVTLMEFFTPLTNGSVEAAALAHDAVARGEIWRLLTCLFLHANVIHLLCNAMGLALFGNMVEVAIGGAYVPLVFLVTGLTGSLFSLSLSGNTSIGASGGVLGLAGFLYVNASRAKVLQQLGVRKTIATVLVLTAFGGLVAFDVLDSAAHLGGFLAGLGLGWTIQSPGEFARTRAFKIASISTSILLVIGALAAIGLIMRPVPPPAPAQTSVPANLQTLAFKPVTPTEVPLVVQSLADPDSNVAYAAAYRLSRLGRKAAPELAKSLSKTAPQARIWAACSLGMMGSVASNSAPQLVALLQDPNRQVRMAAAYALLRTESKHPAAPAAAGTGVAIDGSPVRKFWVSTHHEEILGTRLCLIRGGEKWQPHAPAEGPGMIQGITVNLENQLDWEGFFINVKLAAERYIWEILPHATDLGPLLTALTDQTKGQQAAIALSRVGRRAVKSLAAALDNPEASVRERAAVALGWIGLDASEAVPALVALLQSEPLGENGHCRPCGAAVYALSNMGDEGLAALHALAVNDPGNASRYAKTQPRSRPVK